MDHLAVVEFVSERLKKRGVQQRVADELAKQVIGDIGDEGGGIGGCQYSREGR